MGEAEFRSINNIPPRMLIRAGSTLLVPRAVTVLADVTSRVADNAQLSLAPEASTRRTTIKAGKQDTVGSIATRYRVKAADVARWNSVDVSARFEPGASVVLELPVRTAKATGAKGKGKAVVAKSKATKPSPRVAAAR